MTSTPRHSRRTRGTSGFTLIELLVVIAIIALLIGILLPALGRARDSARSAIDLTNQRQLVTALSLYATEFKGRFPINIFQDNAPLGQEQGVDIIARRWFDEAIIGRYLPNVDRGDTGDIIDPNTREPPTVGGGVMQDPNHDQAGRSYAMNYWASSAIRWGTTPGSFGGGMRFIRPGEQFSVFGGSGGSDPEGAGVGFDASAPFTSKLMLIGPAWAQFVKDSEGDGDFRGFTQETIGKGLFPGERFGLDDTAGMFTDFFGDFGVGNGQVIELDPGQTVDDVASYLPYYRHPRRANGFTELSGNAQMGFADGSVRSVSYNDLVDSTTRRSTYEVLWSPRDERLENEEYGN